MRKIALVILAFSVLMVLSGVPGIHALGPYPLGKNVIASHWTPHNINSTFSFWSNATEQNPNAFKFCSPSPCVDTVSFITGNLAVRVGQAAFELKKVGTPGCLIQYAVWNSNIQNLLIGRAVSSAGDTVVPVQSPNNPIIFSSTLPCSSLTTSYADYVEQFNITAVLQPRTIYHVGLFILSNSTNLAIGTQGVQENFAANVAGVDYPGTEGTCGTGSPNCSAQGTDVPYFEIDGGPVITTEPQSVIFRDDFLYSNPLIEGSWTQDVYPPGYSQGVYTSSGFLVMKASTIGIDTVHVTAPIYTTSGSILNGTVVKRKSTSALIPFSALARPATSSVKMVVGPLASVNSNLEPYGTPNVNRISNCGSSTFAADNNGIEELRFDNSGNVTFTVCGVGTTTTGILETGLSPSVYTVLQIITSGIYCGLCSDRSYPGTEWVFFKVYQEDQTGMIISSTQKSVNITSNVSPLYATSYLSLSQQTTNGGVTGQVSKIDVVQVQNYGSPVCLLVASGPCVRLPQVPQCLTCGPGITGIFAWLANMIGAGDEQLGAIVLFFAVSLGVTGLTLFATKSIQSGGFMQMLVLGFFVTAGFLPLWVLFIVFLIGGAFGVMLLQRLLGDHAPSMGGGDSE